MSPTIGMTISSVSKSVHTGKRYPIRYRATQYTFPSEDVIDSVHFDTNNIAIHLSDVRIISIPLAWIPPLLDATPTDREKYVLSDDRQLIIWDPDVSEINEILRLSDYLQAKPHAKRL